MNQEHFEWATTVSQPSIPLAANSGQHRIVACSSSPIIGRWAPVTKPRSAPRHVVEVDVRRFRPARGHSSADRSLFEGQRIGAGGR